MSTVSDHSVRKDTSVFSKIEEQNLRLQTELQMHLLRFHFRPVVVTCSTPAPRGTKLHQAPPFFTIASPTFI